MEKCIFKHMSNYFGDNDLIYKYQSGFLPGCNTTHHLVHLYHIISKAFDKGLKEQIVFGDISKEFDKVWHTGLLFKLKNMGITEKLLIWISYLYDRQPRVVLQEESAWQILTLEFLKAPSLDHFCFQKWLYLLMTIYFYLFEIVI